jgi:hypothetical protein
MLPSISLTIYTDSRRTESKQLVFPPTVYMKETLFGPHTLLFQPLGDFKALGAGNDKYWIIGLQFL